MSYNFSLNSEQSVSPLRRTQRLIAFAGIGIAPGVSQLTEAIASLEGEADAKMARRALKVMLALGVMPRPELCAVAAREVNSIVQRRQEAESDQGDSALPRPRLH